VAITSLDTLIAGMLPTQFFTKSNIAGPAGGFMMDQFRVRGIPGPGVASAAGLAGAALAGPGFAGGFNLPNPGSGNNYVGLLSASSVSTCTVMLVDRLWENSGLVVTTTTAQTVNSVAWPARDANGTINGDGIIVGLSAVVATTNAALINSMTISYTNSAGVAGRTGSINPSWPALAPINTFVPFELQSGDFGVRSVQSCTLGTSLVTGTVSLVAYRALASISAFVGSNDNDDVLNIGLPKLYNGGVYNLILVNSATTANTVTGMVGFAAG
jgi:hypothetical protein